MVISKKILYFILAVLGLIACNPTHSYQSEKQSEGTLSILDKSEKMDTAYFWKIMDYAFEKGEFDNKIKETAILEQLVQLTPEQIQEFEIIFQQMNQKASTWGVLAAQTAIEGGTSDDRFYYFRCWLISLGKKHFEETIKYPDYLASLDIPFNEQYGEMYCQFEELIPMADVAYNEVTKGKPLDESKSPRSNANALGLFFDSGTEITGTEWKESELPRIIPNLYRKYRSK